jgi:hypothetical protein
MAIRRQLSFDANEQRVSNLTLRLPERQERPRSSFFPKQARNTCVSQEIYR